MAAEQARDLTEDKKVIVVPSVTIPQGITAIINYIEGMSDEENGEHMRQEMEHVRSGQVTYAVRDTVIDDIQISEGDIMGLGDSGILAVGKDIKETTVDLIGHMIDEDSELISVYYGSDVSEEEAENWPVKWRKSIRNWKWNFSWVDSLSIIISFQWSKFKKCER